MERYITFDMDGVLVGLFDVENWLQKIRAHDVSPYVEARPLVSMNRLARRLNTLQRSGWKIRVVSWGSMENDENFLVVTREAKTRWLMRHLKSVHFDEICITHYGVPKSTVGTYHGGILFDDSAANREEWGELAFSEDRIFDILSGLE